MRWRARAFGEGKGDAQEGQRGSGEVLRDSRKRAWALARKAVWWKWEEGGDGERAIRQKRPR